MARMLSIILCLVLLATTSFCYGISGRRVFNYLMSPYRRSHSLTTPQQVHISLSGDNHMRISWITIFRTPAIVHYGTSLGNYTSSAKGDLGQTEWTSSTLQHIVKSNYDVLLLPGDLSYADMYQPWWDTFGYLVQPLASKRPWMVTQGNHEIEKIPKIHKEKFTAYNARWVMPYEESGSPSNLFYSFEVGGVHVIMLGSYAEFESDSTQYHWLMSDLKKVDRKRTPWLVVVMHAPWYNSNRAHQSEYESIGMKNAMEDVLYEARVDVVFAGHVHAYERFSRVYKERANECGPVYITIGDGGNREGLDMRFLDPQPKLSAYREPSFGHGVFYVKNATHAVWTWHRNDYHVAVASDQVVLRNLASVSACYNI
ncbi:hypothetical protein RD792_014228 [Penstemon davidsonii]|uniref:Purple acid phosphatase n=1 Tax=Penstemon davidsonii TaxID=160366 RepID=A0ABR0CP84_9LAMI|nr:hypothetical protein RD792_014228 [Penstemon davidsonii]